MDKNKTMRVTKNQNDDLSWSNLNHDVLFLVMVWLGVLDFPAFSKVCKSWRSAALSNRNRFLASRPPMSISISTDLYEKVCYLEDFDGRMFKTIIPHSADRNFVGLTCGYLILFGEETHDLWLVNPITRHELYFPCVPFFVDASPRSRVQAIMVFSPSISGWVFVLVNGFTDKVWFSIVGTGKWNHVSSTSSILELRVFKRKIYILNADYSAWELRLNPERKFTLLLETKNVPKTETIFPEFVGYGQNAHVLQYMDLGEINWVCPEKTKEEYAFSVWQLNLSAAVERDAVERESWWTKTNKKRQRRFKRAHMCGSTPHMWYFPQECLNVHVLDE